MLWIKLIISCPEKAVNCQLARKPSLFRGARNASCQGESCKMAENRGGTAGFAGTQEPGPSARLRMLSPACFSGRSDAPAAPRRCKGKGRTPIPRNTASSASTRTPPKDFYGPILPQELSYKPYKSRKCGLFFENSRKTALRAKNCGRSGANALQRPQAAAMLQYSPGRAWVRI